MQQTTSHILMVRPSHFGYNDQTALNNVFQGSVDISNEKVQSSAIDEFDHFVQKLTDKGVHVQVVQDSDAPIKPDAVFPNNWFCTLPDASLYLFPMFAPNRRFERRDDIVTTLQKTYEIKKIEDWSISEAENLILEGTGSIIFDHINQQLFACISQRTNEQLLKKFSESIGYQAVLFNAEDENAVPIYHTNVMMHIGTSYAVVCLESIINLSERKNVEKQLSKNGRIIVSITRSQVRQYAGNMLQVQNDAGQLYTVLSAQALGSLTEDQKLQIQSSSEFLPMEIPVIETVGGGSARCMMAEIFLPQKHSN